MTFILGRLYIWITIQVYDTIDIGGSYTWIDKKNELNKATPLVGPQNGRSERALHDPDSHPLMCRLILISNKPFYFKWWK